MGKETPLDEMMNTHEVAEYLRIKERKVYDLVRDKRIPCCRVTGKWLFPKRLIDQWVAANTDMPQVSQLPPAVIAGSHDPLLDWALRESGAELALLARGSLDGLRRFAEGQAMLCGLHVLDAATGEYNLPLLRRTLSGQDTVVITWAWREQGLVVAPGNPLNIHKITDLAKAQARVVLRQPEAGSRVLLLALLDEAGITLDSLNCLPEAALSETDLGMAVLEGRADAGLAVAAAARQFRLDFVPLQRERFDLAIGRRAYFEPALQKLLDFTRSPAFAEGASRLGGYDIKETGKVIENRL
jgi:putative molybdopterin biosynthesis protein